MTDEKELAHKKLLEIQLEITREISKRREIIMCAFEGIYARYKNDFYSYKNMLQLMDDLKEMYDQKEI